MEEIKAMIHAQMDRYTEAIARLEETGKQWHHADAYKFDPEVRKQINRLDDLVDRLDRAYDILHGE